MLRVQKEKIFLDVKISHTKKIFYAIINFDEKKSWNNFQEFLQHVREFVYMSKIRG